MSNVEMGGFGPVRGPIVDGLTARPVRVASVDRSDASAPVPGLKLGSQGPEVKKLHEQLQAIGLSLRKADSTFGCQTQRAVIEFQAAVGLATDEVVGPKTPRALQEAAYGLAVDQAAAVPLRHGSTGVRVGRLQARLQALGFAPGAPDGIYGRKTEHAVKAFQRAKGLHASGVADAATFAALDAAGTPTPTSSPATAAYSDSDGIDPGNLYATINGVDELLAKDSLQAFGLGDGRYVAWTTPSGAGGFEGEGQRLNVFDTQTGATKKIMPEYFPIDDVRLTSTSDGRDAFIVSMTASGSGFPMAAIVDPAAGEVAYCEQATLSGDGDRITIELHGNVDDPEQVTGMGRVLLSAALDSPVITNPPSPV